MAQNLAINFIRGLGVCNLMFIGELSKVQNQNCIEGLRIYFLKLPSTDLIIVKRNNSRRHYMNRMMEERLLKMTIPEQLRNRDQRYYSQCS